MAKIRISMDKMSVAADVGENAEYLFIKIANELFSNSVGKENTKKVLQRLETAKELKYQTFSEEFNEDEKQLKYKGFIYWKCQDCGNIRGFCLSKESKGIHCMHCGSDHLFEEPLRPLYAERECRKTYTYLTNMEDDILTFLVCIAEVLSLLNGMKTKRFTKQ